jgi:hypothetical protein
MTTQYEIAIPNLEIIEVSTVQTIEVEKPVLQVIEVFKGEKGDKGDPGAGSATAVSFAYGDANPTALINLSAGVLLADIKLYIHEMFNNPCRVYIHDGLGNTFLDLNLTGGISSVDVTPSLKYSVSTSLYLSLTPSVGQTSGKGSIFIYLG